MALLLKINTIDRTNQVEWETLEKIEVLTKEPDLLKFRIKNYGTKTYRPSLIEEVELFDGATKIFGGVIVQTKEESDGLLKYFSVECKDWTHKMDQKLVLKTYTNQSAASIISDIVTIFLPAGFTTINVNAPDTIQKIVFNDEQPSKCLQRLADMLGDYDWYVDYNKDIHFFKEGQEPAPFNLSDTSGNFVFKSLVLERNIHQIRNSIIVRGGDKESSLLTETQVADGQQANFIAKPSLKNLTIQKSTDTTCGTFNTLTIGQDGIDDPTTKDVLYNPNSGHIIFRANNKPAVNICVKWSGNQVYPIKIIRRDWQSIQQFGEFQYVIRDATIKSEEAAKQRALAELKKYANKISEGRFTTYTSGLRAGQWITINSIILGITNESFKINRITAKARKPDAFEYEVSLLASETVSMIDLLSQLLIGNPATQFVTQENEILVNVEGYLETITLVESWLATIYPRASPTFTEAMAFAEVWITNPFGLNVIPIWVAGNYYPTGGADKKRAPHSNAGAVLAS